MVLSSSVHICSTCQISTRVVTTVQRCTDFSRTPESFSCKGGRVVAASTWQSVGSRGRRRGGSRMVPRMAPDEEKMTRRSPLDFPVEWDRPGPARRPDVFPSFSPMKPPLPQPLPSDPPEEDEDEEGEKEDQDPDKDPEQPEE